VSVNQPEKPKILPPTQPTAHPSVSRLEKYSAKKNTEQAESGQQQAEGTKCLLKKKPIILSRQKKTTQNNKKSADEIVKNQVTFLRSLDLTFFASLVDAGGSAEPVAGERSR